MVLGRGGGRTEVVGPREMGNRGAELPWAGVEGMPSSPGSSLAAISGSLSRLAAPLPDPQAPKEDTLLWRREEVSKRDISLHHLLQKLQWGYLNTVPGAPAQANSIAIFPMES